MLNSSFCAHPKLEGIFHIDRKMIESKIKVSVICGAINLNQLTFVITKMTTNNMKNFSQTL